MNNMHPDLSNHLHTQECNILIDALQKCHADNPYKRFVGACNEIDRAMTKCLKQERQMKRDANRRKGMSSRQNVQS